MFRSTNRGMQSRIGRPSNPLHSSFTSRATSVRVCVRVDADESLCELVNGLLLTQLDHVIEGAPR